MKIYSPITQPEDIVNKKYIDDTVLNISHSGTLATSGWVADGSAYYQEVAIDNMTANLYPLVWLNVASPTREQISAWNSLTGVDSFNGYVRFYATVQPALAIDYILIGVTHN